MTFIKSYIKMLKVKKGSTFTIHQPKMSQWPKREK